MYYFIAPILFLTAFISSLHAHEINLELGNVETSYNITRIPGDSGDKINLANSFADSNLYHRLSYSHKFSSSHGIRLLYAPLKFYGDKAFSSNFNFGSATFNSYTKTKTEYQFNSYRGTYFYEFENMPDFSLRLGGTLKIRDAKIQLTQGSTKKFKKNAGLVPLLYFFSEYRFKSGLKVALDFDGLMAPQGRAFDIALMTGYYFHPKFHVDLGYRMLEGGADNDNVYNFAQFNYYFMAFNYRF